MAVEPITGLPYQEANSLQTDVLQNEQLNYFAAWFGAVVQTLGDTAPPGSPVNGHCYIIGASATGAWAGKDKHLTVYRDGWQFYAPKEGARVSNLADGKLYVYASGAWVEYTVPTSAAAENVSYDNGTSGLAATDAQAAIDELAAGGGGGTGLGWFDVTAYGATGDVIELTDAVATSADATVTSASASFTSGDIGKYVLLVKSDNTAKQITTIATINSGTSIELAATATFSGTGCRLLYGTDDTAAIQDAIDAAEAAGGGVVYFPGQHCIAGALQDTSRSNSQLVLPIIDYVDSKQMTIVLKGKCPPPTGYSVIGNTPTPNKHSILYGFLDTGAGGALLGGFGPVGTFNSFTYVHCQLRDIAIRMPPDPVLSAANLTACTMVDVDNVVIDTGTYYVQGFKEPTTTNSYGIRMPANNNGALSRLGTVNVSGFYNGYEFAEHCNGFACQAAWGCKQAFVFASGANHASYFDRLMAVHCEKVIVGTGSHYLNVAQLNVEHATSGWWVTDYDIDDASHYLQGNLNWHVVLAGTGVDSTFTVNGGAKLNITRNGYQNRVEQVSVSAAITFEGKHANKHIYHPSADTTARTWTIPANSSVPYPIGTTLTFVNDNGAGALTIAINTDTLRLAGAGTTGSRTLAANGVATAVKITSTSWQINGSGLT